MIEALKKYAGWLVDYHDADVAHRTSQRQNGAGTRGRREGVT
jgi:hypothetical protein